MGSNIRVAFLLDQCLQPAVHLLAVAYQAQTILITPAIPAQSLVIGKIALVDPNVRKFPSNLNQ